MSEEAEPAPEASLVLHGIRHPKKRAFLSAYAQMANISRAATAAGVGRTTHHMWMANDPRYAAAFAQAQEVAIDYMEAEAHRRAVEGVYEPVIYQGKLALDEDGNPLVVRKYDSTLMIFLLKGARPDKYRERWHVTGEVDHKVEVDVSERAGRLAKQLAELRGLPMGEVVEAESWEAEEA